jgi:hypothetical protein
VAAKVRLIFELLDVISITASIESPVNVAGVVTKGVLAILSELDRKAMIRASVNTLPESLNDHFGP